tara:strand:- start:15138 stop:15935 length:798 start_codon:yes stop_codon:yes gene_type:complete
MSKKTNRNQRPVKGNSPKLHIVDNFEPKAPSRPKATLEAKTAAQKSYISSLHHSKITFGIGPAGVGKTYVAARVASHMLLNKEIHKIYLTRPAVEAGRPIGFLKGTMEEKMAPYIAAYGAGFNDGLGQGHFEYLMRTEQIEIVPLNFMQGRSFDEPSMVLFDEAQNSTVDEMKMFLTRIGEGARYCIDGDPLQCMLPSHVKSGLIDGHDKISYLDTVQSVTFTRDDIVRHGLVRLILDAYDDTESDIVIKDSKIEPALPGFIVNG